MGAYTPPFRSRSMGGGGGYGPSQAAPHYAEPRQGVDRRDTTGEESYRESYRPPAATAASPAARPSPYAGYPGFGGAPGSQRAMDVRGLNFGGGRPIQNRGYSPVYPDTPRGRVMQTRSMGAPPPVSMSAGLGSEGPYAGVDMMAPAPSLYGGGYPSAGGGLGAGSINQASPDFMRAIQEALLRSMMFR